MTNEQLAILVGEWEQRLTGALRGFEGIEMADLPEEKCLSYDSAVQDLCTLRNGLQTAIRVLLGKEQSYRPGR